MPSPSKPWSGRFQKATDKQVEAFTASIGFDKRLYKQDIAGSIAHAKMLTKQGIIPQEEAQTIVQGLESILQEIEEGKFPFREGLEDIHMNVEARLIEKVGEVGGKLHTARSRNDQVALDLRMYTKEVIAETIQELTRVQEALIGLAETNIDVIMPGYTHLQRAQPVLLAHHLLAYFEMLERDKGRFNDCLKRVDVMPLGSGALAGVPYPIDREFVAKELGFSRISRNSLDAVADRDFLVEYTAAASLTMMHLSRLAEEIVLWSTEEFGFVDVDEAFTTGSSIMPQKKNPDVAELVRGKTGRVYGHLMAILTTLKGLPLAYNKDLQEDKEGFFDTVDTLRSCLAVLAPLLATIRTNRGRAYQAASSGYLLATDLADYLVGKGMPFREAHHVIGKLVRYCIDHDKGVGLLGLEEYQQFSALFGEDIRSVTIEAALAARNAPGGTAPQRVKEALAKARELLLQNGPTQ